VQTKRSRITWQHCLENLEIWRSQNATPANVAKWAGIHDVVASWVAAHAQRGTLLDVGCKRGELKASTFFPPHVQYFGIDPLIAPGIEYSFPFRCEQIESTSFDNQTFDFVVIKDSVDYFEELDAALASAFRLLKRGGRLLISEGGHSHQDKRMVSNTLLLAYLNCRKFFGQRKANLLRRVKGEPKSPIRSSRIDVRDTYPNGDLTAPYILGCCKRAGFAEVTSYIDDDRLFVSAVVPRG
jgi:SAM-dependent methyltransferase